jgi:predicted Fe-Mo cluster-binding NifX family protein
MTFRKILIPLHENDVAPRFDQASEVLIVDCPDEHRSQNERTMVLPQASPDKLCHLIIAEGVDTVICNGIQDDYYQYLTWKRINVIDSVVGSSKLALKRCVAGKLKPGDILRK